VHVEFACFCESGGSEGGGGYEGGGGCEDDGGNEGGEDVRVGVREEGE